jgi:4'-phosphopantetheinyl transferase
MLLLSGAEIHMWRIDQKRFSLETLQKDYLSWLGPEEQARYQRYYFDQHRRQLLLTRIMTSLILSRYLQDVPAKDLRFDNNEFGKPVLSPGQTDQPLFFNVSHSGSCIVIAVCRHQDIGVDIEKIKPNRRFEKIAGRFFSALETQELLKLEGSLQANRFYRLWTLKEAYIKACGMGLAIPLNDFSFSFPQASSINVSFTAKRGDNPRRWQFWQIDCGAEFRLALALKSASKIQHISSKEVLSVEEFSEREINILSRS